MNKKQWQTPAAVSPYTNDLQVSQEDSFEIRINRPATAYRELRYLLTKVFARKELLNEKEEVLLYYIIEYFQNLRSISNWSDRQDIKKLSLFQTVKLYLKFRDQDYPEWAKAQLKILIPHFRMTPRAFLGLRPKRLTVLFRTINRRLKKSPPPVRYIGVGYRDKGATTDTSKDGSPSWKEVASTPLSILLQGEIRRKELRRIPLIDST